MSGAPSKIDERVTDELHVERLLRRDRAGDVGIRGRLPGVGEHRAERAGVVEAEVSLGVRRVVHDDPERAKHLAKSCKMHGLVVDEHTVEIEDRRHHHRSTPAPMAIVARIHTPLASTGVLRVPSNDGCNWRTSGSADNLTMRRERVVDPRADHEGRLGPG